MAGRVSLRDVFEVNGSNGELVDMIRGGRTDDRFRRGNGRNGVVVGEPTAKRRVAGRPDLMVEERERSSKGCGASIRN